MLYSNLYFNGVRYIEDEEKKKKRKEKIESMSDDELLITAYEKRTFNLRCVFLVL